MDEKFIEMIEKEMEADLKYLDQLAPESEEYSVVLDNYNKLQRLLMDMKKNERDRKDQNLHKFIGYGVDVGKFAVLLGVYCTLYKVGLKFEETGTISAHPMRDLIGSINPFRRK